MRKVAIIVQALVAVSAAVALGFAHPAHHGLSHQAPAAKTAVSAQR